VDDGAFVDPLLPKIMMLKTTPSVAASLRIIGGRWKS
jgi:hypothetical protein